MSWQHAPDLWVTTFARSANEALRYANGLADEPFATQTPFTFDLLPHGAELSYIATDTMSFGPSDADTGTSDDVVAVQLISTPTDRESPGYCPVFYEDDDRTELTGTDVCPLSRTPAKVGEHAGELVGDRTVNVFLPDGLVLQVSAGGALSLNRDDMLRFVEGIEVTEFALPPPDVPNYRGRCPDRQRAGGGSPGAGSDLLDGGADTATMARDLRRGRSGAGIEPGRSGPNGRS